MTIHATDHPWYPLHGWQSATNPWDAQMRDVMGDCSWSWSPSKRHLNGANMLFCDGHVEYGRIRKWVEHRDDVMRRWNRDHQPHPKSWMVDLTLYP